MRILVTGSNGFIGSHACAVLGQEDEVKGVDIDTVDLADYPKTKKVFEAFMPDYVIHCAANGNVDECEKDHDMAIRNNVIATRNIASLCADYDAGIVFCSTDHVYRYEDFTDYLREYDETKGASYYGFTKALCEKEIESKVKKHYIARLCWQYGLLEPGFPHDMRRVGVVDLAIEAYKNNTPLSISKESHIYTSNVYDTIDVFKFMIEDNLSYGVYNVASENSISMWEIYDSIFTKMNLPKSEYSRLMTESDEKPHVLTADPYYLKMYGYKMPTFEEGLTRFFNDVYPEISI